MTRRLTAECSAQRARALAPAFPNLASGPDNGVTRTARAAIPTTYAVAGAVRGDRSGSAVFTRRSRMSWTGPGTAGGRAHEEQAQPHRAGPDLGVEQDL